MYLKLEHDFYFMTNYHFDCRLHDKNVSPADDICTDFKEKVYTDHTIDNWETVIINKRTDEDYGVKGVVFKCNH